MNIIFRTILDACVVLVISHCTRPVGCRFLAQHRLCHLCTLGTTACMYVCMYECMRLCKGSWLFFHAGSIVGKRTNNDRFSGCGFMMDHYDLYKTSLFLSIIPPPPLPPYRPRPKNSALLHSTTTSITPRNRLHIYPLLLLTLPFPAPFSSLARISKTPYSFITPHRRQSFHPAC